jgi:hypothetical protein
MKTKEQILQRINDLEFAIKTFRKFGEKLYKVSIDNTQTQINELKWVIE